MKKRTFFFWGLALLTLGTGPLGRGEETKFVSLDFSVQDTVTAPRDLTIESVGQTVLMRWSSPLSGVISYYQIQLDANGNDFGNDANLNYARPLNTFYTDTGFRYGVTYYFRLRAVATDGTLGPFAYFDPITPTPEPDTTAPEPPVGLWTETLAGVPRRITVHWSPATNADGTLASDVDHYAVFHSTQTGVFSDTPITTTSTSATLTLDENFSIHYIRVNAVDTSDNSLNNPQVIEHQTSLTESFLVVQTTDAYLMVPADEARSFTKTATGLPYDIVLEGTRETSLEGGTVVRRVSFNFRNGPGGPVDNVNRLLPERSQIVINYSDDPQTRPPTLYWFNGSRFIPTQAQRTLTQTIYTGPRAGLYEVRTTSYGTQPGLVSVRPRVFTPNGDNANDAVVFETYNPQEKPVSGKLFNSRGDELGALSLGPSPNTLIWDGRLSGEAAPGGVYAYEVTVGDQSWTGTVVVMR